MSLLKDLKNGFKEMANAPKNAYKGMQKSGTSQQVKNGVTKDLHPPKLNGSKKGSKDFSKNFANTKDFKNKVGQESGLVRKVKPEAPKTTKKDTTKKTTAPKTSSYVVKSGDTLSQIAQRNKTSVAAIMKSNPSIKDGNKINVGQKLNFAKGKTPVKPNVYVGYDLKTRKPKK